MEMQRIRIPNSKCRYIRFTFSENKTTTTKTISNPFRRSFEQMECYNNDA